jgi:hypothetical protein
MSFEPIFLRPMSRKLRISVLSGFAVMGWMAVSALNTQVNNRITQVFNRGYAAPIIDKAMRNSVRPAKTKMPDFRLYQV